MAGRLNPPFLSYEDLRRRAEDFLRTHHAAGTIPVPIEEIVQFRYALSLARSPGTGVGCPEGGRRWSNGHIRLGSTDGTLLGLAPRTRVLAEGPPGRGGL